MKEKMKKIVVIFMTLMLTIVNCTSNIVHAQDLSNPERNAIIKEAEKHLGKPYVYGGNGPDEFDCSGYTKYVFTHSINYILPRTAEQQRQHLIKNGKELSTSDKSQWKPGDLIFFGNHGTAEHVAIWYGNDNVIHAIGDKVQINPFNQLIDKDGQKYKIMTVIKTVEDLGGFTLLKQDENGNALAGAVFKVTDPSGKTTNVTSDTNGKVVFTNIQSGNYQLQEIQSPDGYLIDSTVRTITVKAGDNPTEHVYSFVNKQPRGSIVLTKYNDDKSAVVPNTSYQVTGPNGYNQTHTTDKSGKITLNDLKLGEYVFVEKTAGDGYLVNSEPIRVTLSYKDQHTEIITGTAEQTNKEPTAIIEMKKVDSETETAQGDATLKGAVYELIAGEDIYNKAHTIKFFSKSDVVATRTTDENGNMEAVKNLPLGFYQMKETVASEGYLIDKTVYDIHCDYEGQTVTVVNRSQVSKEKVKKQAFQILKISTDGSENTTLIPKAEFTVKLQSEVNEKGWDNAKVYDVLTTDQKGYAKSIELPYGTYVVKETKVPENLFPVSDFIVEVNEDSREPQVWRVMNDAPFKALIKAIKVDEETGKTILLPDTSFKIKNLDTNEYVGYWVWFPHPHYVDTFTTDESGMVMTPDTLECGEYQLEEINAPYGYVLNETPIRFTVSSNSAYQMAEDNKTPVIEVTKEDKSVKGRISVSKLGEQLIAIERDENGNIHFIYDNRPVNGASFLIKAAENIMSPDNQGDILYKKGEVVEELTTSNGYAEIDDLPLGKYTVEESIAGDSFVLNKEIKEVELTYKDQHTEVVFEDTEYVNERQKVEITVIKKDKENGQLLSGAEFGLYAKEDIYAYVDEVPRDKEKPLIKAGELIETVITNNEGKAIFKSDLPLSVYEIKELKAPIGYVSTDQVIEIDATYQGQDIQVIELSSIFENEITKVEVSKKDATTGEELPGAHLTLKEKDGTIFETWMSTNEPHIVKGLEPGKTYELIETSSPYGFAISQKVEFKVEDTGEIQKVEMVDDLVVGKLKWLKTGEVFTHTDTWQTEFGKVETPVFEKEIISNAEISIFAAEDIVLANSITYYEKDELIETLKSGSEAVESKELPVGKYYYTETVVPEPFVQNNEKHYFEVVNSQEDKLQIIESELENVRAKIELNLTKIMEEHPYYANDYKEAYQSVVFGIYAKEDILDYTGEVGIVKDTLVATCGIDELGHLINVPELPIGKYLIKELSTDHNYIISDESHDFEITYEGKDITEIKIDINEGNEIINQLKKTDIIISKIDKVTKEPLANVEFTLYDRDMNEIAKAISDEKGIARFNDMPNGIYYCKETKALDGYALSDEIVKIELTGDSKDNEYHITMTNVLLPAKGDSVDTGDMTNIGLWFSGIVVSGIMILATVKLRNKKNDKKK